MQVMDEKNKLSRDLSKVKQDKDDLKVHIRKLYNVTLQSDMIPGYITYYTVEFKLSFYNFISYTEVYDCHLLHTNIL